MSGLAHTKPQSVKKSNTGRSFFTAGLCSQKSCTNQSNANQNKIPI